MFNEYIWLQATDHRSTIKERGVKPTCRRQSIRVKVLLGEIVKIERNKQNLVKKWVKWWRDVIYTSYGSDAKQSILGVRAAIHRAKSGIAAEADALDKGQIVL